ncbi:MAG: hypothetical protein ABIN36_17405 [Ferruginibacter sp.]
MNAKRMIGLVFFSACFITNILAQASKGPALDAGHEKIYIHFDRPYYTAGETIWFKAYIYNNGLPSMQSNEFYLQMEDGKGRIISKKKYPISGATVSGSISPGDTLLQGYYKIKAITKAIALDDERFLYSKNLFLFSPAEPSQKKARTNKSISLQFFPESGHLIDRIKTQVAFKATDETGNPIAISGVIKSDSATVITTFKSFHDGIGKIAFTPHLSDVLFAQVELNAVKYQFPLPAVEATGIYLKVAEADSGKLFEITRSKKDNDQLDSIRMVVTQNNDTVFQSGLTFANAQTLNGVLKTRNLPSGILHFIILNKNGLPLAERLSFVNNSEYLDQTELLLIKRDSSKRAVNRFELKFKDSIQRSLSISITDFTAQEFPDKENICSRLLLTSDLRGYIYNPAYYFENDDAEHRLALDNLMLTHGWTRYNWKKKPGSKFENIFDDHRYFITISGSVNEINSDKAVSNGNLHLQMLTEDSTFETYDITVNKNGRFKIDSLLFFGNARVLYSYTSASGKRTAVNLHIDKDNTEQLFLLLSGIDTVNGYSAKQQNNVEDKIMPVLTQFSDPKFKQLSTIILKTKLKRPDDRMNEKYASPLFRSTGRIILDNINKPYPNKSLDVVNYTLANMHLLAYDRDYNSFVNRKNFSLQTQKNWIVELLVDETVSSIDIAKTITMDKVAMIKFYEAGFVGVGTSAPGGALAVYLKKYEDDPASYNDPQKNFTYNGYSITQEFYSPDYSLPSPTNNSADNRLTLFWNTFASGKDAQDMKFNFFNNDISKKLHIVVEGFDARGKLIHYQKTFGE